MDHTQQGWPKMAAKILIQSNQNFEFSKLFCFLVPATVSCMIYKNKIKQSSNKQAPPKPSLNRTDVSLNH